MAYDPHEDFDYYTGEWADESDPRNEPPGDPVGCIWAVRVIDWEPISFVQYPKGFWTLVYIGGPFDGRIETNTFRVNHTLTETYSPDGVSVSFVQYRAHDHDVNGAKRTLLHYDGSSPVRMSYE